jgi:hypothetical protein
LALRDFVINDFLVDFFCLLVNPPLIGLGITTLVFLVRKPGRGLEEEETSENGLGGKAKGPGAKGPGAKGPGAEGPGAKGPGAKGPGAKGPGAKGPETKGADVID